MYVCICICVYIYSSAEMPKTKIEEKLHRQDIYT